MWGAGGLEDQPVEERCDGFDSSTRQFSDYRIPDHPNHHNCLTLHEH